MKKALAIVLSLMMILSLAACGGSKSEDPNLGIYKGTTAEMFGEESDITEIYDLGDNLIELKADGKGTLTLDGEEMPMTWTLEGTKFNLVVEGIDSPGTLENGEIIIDFAEMGVNLKFVKEAK